MKKMRMCFPKEKTFTDGFAEYILDCKARSLRDGTIRHYWLWSDLCNSRKNHCGVYLGLYALIAAVPEPLKQFRFKRIGEGSTSF